MNNRELFESFWQDKTGCNGEYIQKDDNNKYYEKSSNEAWLVWQAASSKYEAKIAKIEAELKEAKELLRVSAYSVNQNTLTQIDEFLKG